MACQLTCLRERTPTAFPGTDKGFFSRVGAQVVFQGSRFTERTFTACVGTDKGGLS